MVLIIERKENPFGKDNDPLEFYIKQRIKDNKNCLILVIGGTGTGKSYGTLRLCENLDNDFGIDRCCFTAKQFMDLLDSNLKKGNAVQFDEVGVSLSSRAWASLNNKLINFVLQTFRNLNLIVVFTVPFISMIDSQSRKLFHIILETVKIDREKKEVHMKPFTITYNPRNDKPYIKYPRISRINGGLQTYIRYIALLPSENLTIEYEKKKKQFTTALNKSIRDDINKLEQDKVESNIEKIKTLSNMEQKIMDLMNKRINDTEICKELNIKSKTLQNYKTKIRKKGYVPPNA